MSKELMTERLSIIARYLLLSILVISLTQSPVHAEVFRPIQILLPGNWRTHLIELDHAACPHPGLAWKLPDLIQGLKRNRENDVVVLSAGNNSSIFSPICFLDGGDSARELLQKIGPDAHAIGPDDLELFSGRNLPQHLKKMIWTNIDSDFQIFPGYSRHRAGSKDIWMFNFIGSERLKKVEIENWGQFRVDNSARALRRIAPAVKNEDYSLSLVQLEPEELKELLAELQNLPGTHFIAQILSEDESPQFPQTHEQKNKNVFCFSLKPGHDVLPALNIFSKNNAPPRMTLRMLPLAKHKSPARSALYNLCLARLRPLLNRTLRVITTKTQASTSAFTLRDRLHARFVQSSSGSDIAMIETPEMLHFTDNVISVAQLLSRFPNERIRMINIKGQALLNLYQEVMIRWGSEKIAFSGLELKYLAGRLTSLKVKGQEVIPERLYSIAGSEKTIFSMMKTAISADIALQPPTGQTLWEVWLKGLDSRTIKEEEIINN